MTFRRFYSLFALWLAIWSGSGWAASPASDPLGRAQGLLAALSDSEKPSALAAEASGEGHWSFVNAAGERFTTASAEELKRLLPALAPEATKPGSRLRLVLTEDTVFRYRQQLQELPLASERRTDLAIVVDDQLYALVRRGERPRETFFAEVRANILIELNERRLFDEAVWQLAHPLKRSAVRVLSLEPGGPESVPAAARIDPQTKRALTDQVAPASLEAALRTLARQTVIITTRRDGDTLAFRPSSGPELTLPARSILAAAESADVNLVLLQSANPRQPGARSWWWGRISVGRLDDALGRDHLADFLNALASPQAKLLVAAEDSGGGRVRLTARPMKDESSPRTGIGETLSELASNIVGQVVVASVEASLRDRGRQSELDRRIVPGVPSVLQWVYAGLLALGIAGHRVARGWWERIWPPERRESYGNVFGYRAARSVRGLVYGLLFLPLTAFASVPRALLEVLMRTRGSKTGPVSPAA
jgi:hypothetical protein